MLPEKIRLLNVSIGSSEQAGQLIRASTYEFRYLRPDPDQASMALLMPPSQKLTWQDGDLFPPMDQNLPEGDLFMRIRELYPKQPMTPMHLLALVGRNGIGRLGYSLPDMQAPPKLRLLSKSELLRTPYTPVPDHGRVAGFRATGLRSRSTCQGVGAHRPSHENHPGNRRGRHPYSHRPVGQNEQSLGDRLSLRQVNDKDHR